VAYNPLGWSRQAVLENEDGQAVVDLPPFGYRVVRADEFAERTQWTIDGDRAVFERGRFRCVVDLEKGRLVELTCPQTGENVVPEEGWPQAHMVKEGATVSMGRVRRVSREPDELFVTFEPNEDFGVWFRVLPHEDAVEIEVSHEPMRETFDPGMNAALQSAWRPTGRWETLVTDSPYAVHAIEGTGRGRRKYPEGDWMTSPQWFEEIEGSFTALTFVDLVRSDGSGLLIAHDGSQQWFREGQTVRNVMNVIDPWDEDKSVVDSRVVYRLSPHGPWRHTERRKRAQELFGRRPCISSLDTWTVAWPAQSAGSGELPATFSMLECSPGNVIATALYRESEGFSGKGLGSYAGKGVGYPYVLRLVEFDGVDSEVELRIPGTVAKAYRTSLMGEIEEELPPERREGVAEGPVLGGRQSVLRMPMRPHEIATVYLDLEEGRKQTRDLDAMRKIWATVHRVGE
jgi:alpha-mannosidase